MPVNLPEPLGPKLFILGEPLLSRYYTVYDWKEAQIGFGLAATQANKEALAQGGQQKGHEDEDQEEIYSFMQVTVTVSVRYRQQGSPGARGRRTLTAPGLALPM